MGRITFSWPGTARRLMFAAFLLSVLAFRGSAADPADAERFWPGWRGPHGTGVSTQANPPIEWTSEKNVRWSRRLPGMGHSTPVVWGDRIYLTTAVPFGEALPPRMSGRPGAHNNLPVTHRHHFYAIAVSRKTGDVVWQKKLTDKLPHEGGHETASLASNSPVTDGEHIFAFFGSHGLFCLDTDGNVIWKKDLGNMHTKHGHGEGASPVLHGDTLVVNWDHEEQSFIVAFDKATGDERWKLQRDEVTSWASPIVYEHAGTPQLIVSGTGRIRGYDVRTGKVLWACGGLSANVVASPVASNGMVFAASSYDTRAMLAIRLDGSQGDITGTEQVLWRRTHGTPYVPSPLLYGNSIYFLRHYQNILSKVSTQTGRDQDGPFRLGGLRNIYASPVGAAGRIYVTDLHGNTLVMSHNDKSPKMLALNRLPDSFSASAALVDGELYLRGVRALYCIAEDEPADAR